MYAAVVYDGMYWTVPFRDLPAPTLWMFIIIAFYFCFLNHTKRFDIRAPAATTTIEANIAEEPTQKKKNWIRERRKKEKRFDGKKCMRISKSTQFGIWCVCVCVCAEKFYGDACLSAKAKRVKVLCITLMRLCERRFLFFFVFFLYISHSVF